MWDFFSSSQIEIKWDLSKYGWGIFQKKTFLTSYHKKYHIPEYRISKIYLSYIIPHEMKCEHLKQKFWGHIMPRLQITEIYWHDGKNDDDKIYSCPIYNHNIEYTIDFPLDKTPPDRKLWKPIFSNGAPTSSKDCSHNKCFRVFMLLPHMCCYMDVWQTGQSRKHFWQHQGFIQALSDPRLPEVKTQP